MNPRIDRSVDPLADMKQKIRALRAMTLERGCSEAEAMAAARKAAELMARYDLDADLLDRPPIVELRVPIAKSEKAAPWSSLWSAISAVAQVEGWTNSGMTVSMVYYGFEPDTLLAEYLHEVCRRHVENARVGFRASREYTRRRTPKTRKLAVSAFLQGFILQLATRLRVIFMDRLGGSEANAKAALVEKALQDREMKFSSAKGKAKSLGHHEAFGAGAIAARGVTIGLGVDGARGSTTAIGATRLIGRVS